MRDYQSNIFSWLAIKFGLAASIWVKLNYLSWQYGFLVKSELVWDVKAHFTNWGAIVKNRYWKFWKWNVKINRIPWIEAKWTASEWEAVKSMNYSGVAMSTTRVTFRVAINIITAARIVIDAHARNVRRASAFNGRRGRRTGCGNGYRQRSIVSPRRHALIDGIQTFGLFERSDLVGWWETLKSCNKLK